MPPGTRYGVKGSAASSWLAQQGVLVPALPNRFTHWSGPGSGRCLRLGNAEFLVEHDAAIGMPATSAANSGGTANVWVLLRSDCSLVLDGSSWPDALAQACSFDFQRLRAEPDLVVMTLLAGIGVTLVREPHPDADRLALRLWCDASYAHYLQDCLQRLAAPAHGEPR